eukprot:988325-Prymnesium_polylepis.1
MCIRDRWLSGCTDRRMVRVRRVVAVALRAQVLGVCVQRGGDVTVSSIATRVTARFAKRARATRERRAAPHAARRALYGYCAYRTLAGSARKDASVRAPAHVLRERRARQVAAEASQRRGPSDATLGAVHRPGELQPLPRTQRRVTASPLHAHGRRLHRHGY